MLQTAIRKFRMKKFTKSEANLTKLTEPEEAEKSEKSVRGGEDWEDVGVLRREAKNAASNERSHNFSRPRVVSCPESDDLRKISRGFDSTIFDLKRICEEGLH